MSDHVERTMGQAVEQFIAYYRGLAQRAGGVPRRSDFDPLDIPEILPKVWIYGRVDGDYLIRVTGTEFDDRYGGDVRQGDSIKGFLPPQAHARIIKRLDKVLEAGWYCHGWSNVADPVSDALIERAYGPMLDHNGAQTLVIGVTDFGSVLRRWGDMSPPRVAAHIDFFDPLTGDLREAGFDPD